MKKIYSSLLIICLSFLSLSAYAQPAPVTFSYTGAAQSYTVGSGVTSLAVDVQGAWGGLAGPASGLSGLTQYSGGRVQATLSVSPGQVLAIMVGGPGLTGSASGGSTGGFNGGGNTIGNGTYGGGGGGGASDVRQSPYTLNDRVVVAGGGGGEGYNGGNMAAGAGGNLIGGTGATSGGTAAQGGNTTAGTGGSAGGYSGYTAASSGSFGSGGAGGGGIGGGGGGGWYGGGGGVWGGGGGGSSYASGTLTSAVTMTQGYNAGSGMIVVTVLCNSPGAIVGTPPSCLGSSSVLTDPTGTSGGTWISSNPTVATANPTTGSITGSALGTAVITYSVTSPCGGASALATIPVTINPLTVPLTGSAVLCTGNTTTLADTGTGVWASSNTAIATVSSAGVVTGMGAGTATISYTLVTGCAPATKVVTVNIQPSAITGVFAECIGATTTLSDGVPSGIWSSSAPGIALVNASTGLVTGVSAGVATITYTAPGGCIKTVSFTVYPNPSPIGSIGSGVCVGSTTTLTDGTTGGIWSSSNIAVAGVDLASGTVTGYRLGVVNITYTMGGSGCQTTAPLTVNPVPSAIVGVGPGVCLGSAVSLSDPTTGGTWTSSDITKATVGLYSGAVTGVGVGSATISYSLLTGCYALAVLPVNQLPVAYSLTGGGSFCPTGTGVHIGLSYSESGVTYQLYLSGSTPEGSSVTGSSTSIDFGLFSAVGTYTAIGTNPTTGCSSNMTGSKSVSIYIPPIAYDVTGGGGYCPGSAGMPVGTDGSQTGVTYQLYRGSGPLGSPMSGSGGSLSFGTYSAPATYTIIGTSTTNGCATTMNGNATVYVYPAPTSYTVGGNGGYCAGTAGAVVSLSGSDAGSSYQLLRGTTHVGTAMTGTGDSLYFPPQTTTGIYTIEVTDGIYGCTEMMTGSSNVVLNPLPVAYGVTGGGSYCSGGSSTVHIGLGYSSLGINYELISPSSTIIATVPGSNTSLDFGIYSGAGTYTAMAVNSITGCANNMTGSATVTLNTSPSGSYTVTGGGAYCIGGSGEDIYISGSQSGIHYQLYKGTTVSGSYHSGTGGTVDFGYLTSPGTYTVVAIDPATLCSTHLTGSAGVTVNPLPVAHLVSAGGQYCTGGAGIDITVNGSDMNTQYQLLLGSTAVPGANVYGSGVAIDMGVQTTAGAYTVTAVDTITGCSNMMTGTANVTVDPLPTIYNMTGGGSYCAGGSGVSVGLDGSSLGISYKLYDGALLASYSGSGSPLSFGSRTSTGAYSVIAVDLLTGCMNTMSGLALVSINPLPTSYIIEGGGSFCAGGSGVDVYLSGSDTGVNYQLYQSGTAVGPLQGGTGTSVDFGPETGVGAYTVLAVNASTTCNSLMSSTVMVNTVNPTVYTVIGGGAYCSGGTGVPVILTSSSTADAYQLYVDGIATGPIVYGTGTSLSFGPQTTAGSYTVVAQDNSMPACTDTMAAAATVGIDPLPTLFSVTGTGTYCVGAAGLHVGLSASSTSINYQLYSGTSTSGAPVSGSGSSLDFGVRAAGSYMVIATDAITHCADTMTGMAVLTTSPLPNAYAVTAPDSGYYCATDTGVHIWLSNSDAGITYQLYRGTTPVGSGISGTGSAVDMGLESVAGSYTVFAVNATSTCSSTMANNVSVAIIPLPTVHDVTGGGGYCLAGGDGVHIGLDHSDAGIYYTLYHGVSAVDSLFGIDSALDFGLYLATGTYTVVGNSRITYCPNNMFGSANVYIDTLMTPHVLIREYPNSGVGVWHVDSVVVSVTNGGTSPSYQWYINGHLIAGATSSTFANYELFNNDSVSCSVTASGPCGGLTTSEYVIVKLQATGVNTVSVEGSDVKLIPNPNKGTFSVKGSFGVTTTQDVTLEVTNMLGQVLYTKQVTVTNGNIDEQVQLGGDLANGMYLLNLRTGSENTVFHFVIEQ